MFVYHGQRILAYDSYIWIEGMHKEIWNRNVGYGRDHKKLYVKEQLNSASPNKTIQRTSCSRR